MKSCLLFAIHFIIYLLIDMMYFCKGEAGAPGEPGEQGELERFEFDTKDLFI